MPFCCWFIAWTNDPSVIVGLKKVCRALVQSVGRNHKIPDILRRLLDNILCINKKRTAGIQPRRVDIHRLHSSTCANIKWWLFSLITQEESKPRWALLGWNDGRWLTGNMTQCENLCLSVLLPVCCWLALCSGSHYSASACCHTALGGGRVKAQRRHLHVWPCVASTCEGGFSLDGAQEYLRPSESSFSASCEFPKTRCGVY